MNFDWSEFLIFAYKLANQKEGSPGEQEARLRTSTSRAYYSVFHFAKKHMASKGIFPTTDHQHIEVRDYFTGQQDEESKQVGLGLNRLLLNRRKADYHDSIKDDLKKMNQLDLMMASSTLKKLNGL